MPKNRTVMLSREEFRMKQLEIANRNLKEALSNICLNKPMKVTLCYNCAKKLGITNA